MRLIDADALVKELGSKWNVLDDQDFANKAVWRTIEAAPTVDVPDRKVGKWEHGREIARTMLGNDVLSIDYEDWHCSCCGRRYKEYVLPYNFCPNCGAQMERIKE